MKEFENIVVGRGSVPSLIVTVVLMIAIPVAFALYWRIKRKEQTNIGYLIAGIVGFLVSARALELAVHYFCLIADNPVSRFINGHTVAYVVYGAVTAGVFEECGRHLVLKYVMKKRRTRENAVFYGIGHGGIEIIAVVLPTMIVYLAAALLFSSGDVENALGMLNVTEETAEAALATVRAAASFDPAGAAMSVAERLFTFLIHVGLTVVVFYGVREAKKLCLPAAIVLHMLVDALPALYQKGAAPILAVEVWIALCAAAIVSIAVKLYGKMKTPPSAEAVS